MNFSQAFQLISGLSFAFSAIVILQHVRQTTLSDKYGVIELGFLAVLFYLNISRNWFSLVSLETGVLVLIAGIAFMALGISCSIQLTEYSRARRSAIQELALLRQRYQAAVKGLETSDTNQAAQTH